MPIPAEIAELLASKDRRIAEFEALVGRVAASVGV
jgi:hypothetical protein